MNTTIQTMKLKMKIIYPSKKKVKINDLNTVDQ